MSERKISLRGLRRFRITQDTKFHIDDDWWENSGRDFRLYLRDQLCEECREQYTPSPALIRSYQSRPCALARMCGLPA